VKATTDFFAQQKSIEKPSPYDTHPPLKARIEQAQRLRLEAPGAAGSERMISLIDELGALEGDLLKKLIPATAAANLKPLNWEVDGAGIYLSAWRKQVAGFLEFLAAKRLDDFPLLVLDPRPLAALIPNPPKVRLNQNQLIARAQDVLFCAFSLSLVDNGWKLTAEPGNLVLENGARKIDPNEVMAAIRGGKLTVVAWSAYRTERAIGNWPLAVLVPVPAAV
jgi:hypothetical protein